MEVNGSDFTNFKEFGLSLWFDITKVNVEGISSHEKQHDATKWM